MHRSKYHFFMIISFASFSFFHIQSASFPEKWSATSPGLSNSFSSDTCFALVQEHSQHISNHFKCLNDLDDRVEQLEDEAVLTEKNMAAVDNRLSLLEQQQQKTRLVRDELYSLQKKVDEYFQKKSEQEEFIKTCFKAVVYTCVSGVVTVSAIWGMQQ